MQQNMYEPAHYGGPAPYNPADYGPNPGPTQPAYPHQQQAPYFPPPPREPQPEYYEDRGHHHGDDNVSAPSAPSAFEQPYPGGSTVH